MLSFTFKTNKEQYLVDLQAFQLLYGQQLRKTQLMKAYWGLFWVFIVALLFFGYTIRDQFYGQGLVIVAMFVICAFIPINWYLNQLVTKSYTNLVANDTAECFAETTVVFDETGMNIHSANSNYQVNWAV